MVDSNVSRVIGNATAAVELFRGVDTVTLGNFKAMGMSFRQ